MLHDYKAFINQSFPRRDFFVYLLRKVIEKFPPDERWLVFTLND